MYCYALIQEKSGVRETRGFKKVLAALLKKQAISHEIERKIPATPFSWILLAGDTDHGIKLNAGVIHYKESDHKGNITLIPYNLIRIPLTTLSKAEIDFQFVRASGPGGQHVNKVATAVRATVANGLTVLVQQHRSQHQNKSEAFKRIREKHYELQIQEVLQKLQFGKFEPKMEQKLLFSVKCSRPAPQKEGSSKQKERKKFKNDWRKLDFE